MPDAGTTEPGHGEYQPVSGGILPRLPLLLSFPTSLLQGDVPEDEVVFRCISGGKLGVYSSIVQ